MNIDLLLGDNLNSQISNITIKSSSITRNNINFLILKVGIGNSTRVIFNYLI